MGALVFSGGRIAFGGGGSGSGTDTPLLVADAAARLALVPTNGLLVLQLDTDELWAYDITTLSWLRIGQPLMFVPGSVLFADTDGSITEDNPEFFFDDVANLLGVGTNTPGGKIHANYLLPDDTGGIGGLFQVDGRNTMDASVTLTALQTVADATVAAGFTNDKALSGLVNTITRGDGTDDGTLDAMAGVINLMFHNSGAGGVTNKSYGNSAILITLQGTITDHYDYYSLRNAAGGTLTNHYGVYIEKDATTPVKNWLSGDTKFGGVTYAEAPNTSMIWNDVDSRLEIGPQNTISGDIEGSIRNFNIEVDPFEATTASYVGYAEATFTASVPNSVIGNYNIAKINIDLGQTVSGALAGVYANVSRSEATDEGALAFSGAYVGSITQGASANKTTGLYATFLAGFHSIDANPNQIADMYDFLAMPGTIGAGAVTNRYGIYINPDAGYTKINWLSGLTRIGGSVFTSPAEALDVEGYVRTDSGLILEDPGAGTQIITMHAPSGLAASYDLTLPPDDGNVDEVLVTDGGGVTTWKPVNSINAPDIATQAVPAAGTIHINDAVYSNVRRISGSGGAVTVDTTTGMDAGTLDMQEVILIGQSDTDTVTINPIGNMAPNGSVTLGANDAVTFRWDASLSLWLEMGRSD